MLTGLHFPTGFVYNNQWSCKDKSDLVTLGLTKQKVSDDRAVQIHFVGGEYLEITVSVVK